MLIIFLHLQWKVNVKIPPHTELKLGLNFFLYRYLKSVNHMTLKYCTKPACTPNNQSLCFNYLGKTQGKIEKRTKKDNAVH